MIIGIITARYNSKRLPGKALLDIGGKPVIRHIYDTVSSIIDTYVLTSRDSKPIVDYCMDNNLNFLLLLHFPSQGRKTEQSRTQQNHHARFRHLSRGNAVFLFRHSPAIHGSINAELMGAG